MRLRRFAVYHRKREVEEGKESSTATILIDGIGSRDGRGRSADEQAHSKRPKTQLTRPLHSPGPPLRLPGAPDEGFFAPIEAWLRALLLQP